MSDLPYHRLIEIGVDEVPAAALSNLPIEELLSLNRKELRSLGVERLKHITGSFISTSFPSASLFRSFTLNLSFVRFSAYSPLLSFLIHSFSSLFFSIPLLLPPLHLLSLPILSSSSLSLIPQPSSISSMSWRECQSSSHEQRPHGHQMTSSNGEKGEEMLMCGRVTGRYVCACVYSVSVFVSEWVCECVFFLRICFFLQGGVDGVAQGHPEGNAHTSAEWYDPDPAGRRQG